MQYQIHTYTHTAMLKYIHMCIHAAYAYIQIHTHVSMQTHTHTHIDAMSHTLIQHLSFQNSSLDFHKHTPYINTNTRAAYPYLLPGLVPRFCSEFSRPQIHAYMHTHTHTHTHTHAHAYIHTHISFLIWSSDFAMSFRDLAINSPIRSSRSGLK